MARDILAVLATRLALCAAVTFVGLGGLALAQSNKPDPAPVPEKTEAPKVPSQVSPDTPGLALDPKTYVIGPEDIMMVRVWREPDFTGAKGVRPDGKITMPLIGDIQAAGLTPERLENQLKEALSQYVKTPSVNVEIIQVNSKKYSVTGGVNRPGVFPLIEKVTVFQALNYSGGFREFANKKDIVVLRVDGKRFHFNYNEFIKGKKLDDNIELQNGDTVIVKE